MNSRRLALLVSFLLALFFLGCASAPTGAAEVKDQEQMIVTGRLERVMAVGGETTGLGLMLDTRLTLRGTVYRRIEVDRMGVDISPLIGAHVELTGKLVYRKGVERGEYPALELIGIRRLE